VQTRGGKKESVLLEKKEMTEAMVNFALLANARVL
jgi:hypothetical protein